ncbi:MAG TPA: hypothetical protein VHZ95_20025 [Polyangiales bacterium]|nr:hypothetical protein [Polyangiales bacterium]
MRSTTISSFGSWAIALALCLNAGAASAKPKKKAPPPPPSAASEPAAPVPDEPATAEPEAPNSPPPSAASTAAPAKPIAAKSTPEQPGENAQATAPSAESQEKLAALRADVGSLMDDMVEARSRAAMLGKTLFKTQVRVNVQNLAAPDPVLVKILLKLDGAPIYRGDAAAISGDDAHQVFQSFIAPGAHVLSAEVEQRSKDDAAYGYSLHETYRFQALREKRSELTLILDDDSDASDFAKEGAGDYDVRTKLRVKSKNLNEE